MKDVALDPRVDCEGDGSTEDRQKEHKACHLAWHRRKRLDWKIGRLEDWKIVISEKIQCHQAG